MYIGRIVLLTAMATCFLLLTGCQESTHTRVADNINTLDSNKPIISSEAAAIPSSAEGSDVTGLSDTSEEIIDLINHTASLDELLDIYKKYGNKIDGAYAEAYSYNLLRFYRERGALSFIKALAAREVSCVNLNSELLAGEVFFSEGTDAVSTLEKDIEEIKTNSNLSSKELNALTAIMAAFQLIQEKNKSVYKAEKDDFTIKMGSKSLSLYDRENVINLQDTLGKPKLEKIEQLGPGSDTFNGSFIKELSYEGLKLQLFAPKGDEKAFWIFGIDITGKGFTTVKDIGVGNSLAELKKAYTGIAASNDGRQDENNCAYETSKSDEYLYLTFEIKGGIIAEIKMFVRFP